MTRRALLTLLTLLVAACLALGVVLSPGMYLLAKGASQPKTTQTPTPTLAPLPPSPPNDRLSPELEQQMDAIQREVVQLRGLMPTEGLKRNVLTREELRRYVIADFFKDYSDADAARDSRILSALGWVEPGFDLLAFYTELYSEQVAGFYDSTTKEMYVVQGESFGGPERLTYAHEFTHALQDQAYDLRDGLNLRNEYCQEHSEYCLAVQSLIEGDAAMTSYDWFFQYSTEQDRSEMQSFSSDYASPVYDSAPEFFQQDFIFPYIEGQEFVQSLFDRGGLPAIRQAYADPPTSSEQILHPDAYPDDRPVAIDLPDLSAALGEDWQLLDSGVLGEWYSYLFLTQGYREETRLSKDTARQAAAGWEGDAYSAYWNASRQQLAFLQRWRWEEQKDALEFWSALQAYGEARWGRPARQAGGLAWENTADGYVRILRREREVLWLMAPDAAAAAQLLQER